MMTVPMLPPFLPIDLPDRGRAIEDRRRDRNSDRALPWILPCDQN